MKPSKVAWRFSRDTRSNGTGEVATDVRLMMKIGVDASCWPNKRGYGRYAQELLRALLAFDKENEYWMFLDARSAQQSKDLPEPY